MKNVILPAVAILSALILCFVTPLTLLAIENSECMDCHSDESLTREGNNDLRISNMAEQLFIDEDQFNHSVHHINGITCIDCHADIEELTDEEIPHKQYLSAVNCAMCHEEEGEAFSESVHIKIRGKGITMQCYACHGYHYVKRLESYSVAQRENDFCLKCHNPYQYHDWLPQKKSHFDFVECTVCHAPTVPQHINLNFFDLVTNKFLDSAEIIETLGIEFDEFMPLIDEDKDGIISSEEFENLHLILRQKNIHTIFHAELVADLEPILHLVVKGGAEKDCVSCHSANSPLFKAVNIVLTRDDGSVEHYEVTRDVLESYSMSHFSALAGTRVKLLDKIGLTILACGIFAAAGHLFIRVCTIPIRRRKNENDNG